MPKLRKMLTPDTPYTELLMRLIETQSMETLIKWSTGYAENNFLPIYEKQFPEDTRPRTAIQAARDVAVGKIKPATAKPLIKPCFVAAQEAEGSPAAQAAARAVYAAAAVFQTPSMSLAVAYYGAAAVAYTKAGLDETAAVYDQIAKEVFEDEYAELKAIAVENESNPVKVNWGC